MNSDLPNTIYTEKLTDKTVLAKAPPANASFKEPSHLEPSNTHKFITLLLGNKEAKHRCLSLFFMLSMPSGLCRDLEFSHSSGSRGSTGHGAPAQGARTGQGPPSWASPGYQTRSRNSLPWHRERCNCAHDSISCWQGKLLVICRNYPDWNQEVEFNWKRIISQTSSNYFSVHLINRWQPGSVASPVPLFCTLLFPLLGAGFLLCLCPQLCISQCVSDHATPCSSAAPQDQTGHCSYYPCLGSQK